MQARIAPMGKLVKTDETLLAKYHGLRKVSRDRNELCNHGGVAEWLNAPVLKTGIPQGIVGSNAHTSCITMYLQKQNTGGGILDTRID